MRTVKLKGGERKEVHCVVGLRDRALIGLMVFTFARVGAAVGMKVEDYFIQGRRGWVRLHEKGGKRHDVPANHNLDEYLEAYIKGVDLETDPKGASVPHGAREIRCAHTTVAEPGGCLPDDSKAS